MKTVAYIVENRKGLFGGFIASVVPDDDDSSLFVTATTEKYHTLEEAQKELEKLPKDIKVYLNPIKSSESGLSWLSELEEANKDTIGKITQF